LFQVLKQPGKTESDTLKSVPKLTAPTATSLTLKDAITPLLGKTISFEVNEKTGDLETPDLFSKANFVLANIISALSNSNRKDMQTLADDLSLPVLYHQELSCRTPHLSVLAIEFTKSGENYLATIEVSNLWHRGYEEHVVKFQLNNDNTITLSAYAPPSGKK